MRPARPRSSLASMTYLLYSVTLLVKDVRNLPCASHVQLRNLFSLANDASFAFVFMIYMTTVDNMMFR